MGAAEDHATVGREGNRDACLRAMDEAYRQLGSGEGEGFFSTQGFFAGWNEASWSGWRGWCYALLRDSNRALGELAGAGEPATGRRGAVLSVTAALAHAVDGDPEPACAAAQSAVDESERIGYVYGVEGVRFVRARFPRRFAGLSCVAELDERLARVTL